MTNIDVMSDQQLMKIGKDMLKERGIENFDLQGIQYGEKVRIFENGELEKGEYETLSDDGDIHLLGSSNPNLSKNDIIIKKKKMN